MRKMLLLLLAVTSSCFSLSWSDLFPEKRNTIQNKNNHLFTLLQSILDNSYHFPHMTMLPFSQIREMLYQQAPTLNSNLINKALTSLACCNRLNIEHKDILTLIDYSLPSSKKRLWVFDLKDKKLLFHTYVSHGIRSGNLITNYFSNKQNSKASSLGVYRTENSYHGRDGLSLVLNGLDVGFNDNAISRAVVMHGGWYVEENFIKRYGRAGRSWGCPALPSHLTKPIINTIKDRSLFVIYYPSENWFVKSKFLNCDRYNLKQLASVDFKTAPLENDSREKIYYADLNRNNSHEESDPVMVLATDDYEQLFQKSAPVGRMLRRQINSKEYVALSPQEFKTVLSRSSQEVENAKTWHKMLFVVPEVKLERGYYKTQMRVVPLGKINAILPDGLSKDAQNQTYTLQFDGGRTVNLRLTNHFIRWLGL